MQKFRIGHCRTEKLVTSNPDLDSLETPEELFDAMAMLDTVAARTYRREGANGLVQHLQEQSDEIRESLKNDRVYEIMMREAGCTTSFDLRRYAQLLLLPEFKD